MFESVFECSALCVYVCLVWMITAVDVKGNVFTSPGLSEILSCPQTSTSKNAFGMLNQGSKWINHKKQNTLHHIFRFPACLRCSSSPYASLRTRAAERGDEDLLVVEEEWIWPCLCRWKRSSELNEMWGPERCFIRNRLQQKFCSLAHIIHGCRSLMNK